jgi:hypothetical protein
VYIIKHIVYHLWSIKTETSAESWGSRYDKLEVERQNAAGDNEDVFPHFGIILTPSL